MYISHPMHRGVLVACVFLSTVATGAPAMATEEPKFTVVQHTEAFDVRRYAPVVVAETTVEGDWGEASNQGFRRLAGYIFGGNKSRTKFAMTAPVGMQDRVQVPKTALDTVRANGAHSWIVSFTMPAETALAAMPIPDDARVTLREVPVRLVAAKRVGGWWSAANFADDGATFLRELAAAGLKPTGTGPVLARYNPPWIPFFMRRNEVLVELAP